MEFKKIQLNGFKSFADKTNFLIEDGLTGIVGPNGCGKSNIVESLRWAMGETSAKSMRGSGMEDVIFNGTSNKASKNIAEVSIDVENKNNEGPVQYRDQDQMSVRRKIEKDKGSKFYINDKEIEDFVLNDRIEGAKNFNVNATPTIIINNKKFEKSLNYKNLKKSLEKLI